MSLGDFLESLLRNFYESTNPTPELMPMENPNGNGILVAVKNGYQVQNFVGQQRHRRMHTFRDLGGFAMFMNRAVPDGRRGDVDIVIGDDLVVAAISPANAHCDVISCELVKHPAFKAWDAVLGTTMTHKELAGHIRAQRATIAGDMTGDVLLQQVSRLNVVTGGTLESELDERSMTRFRGSSQKSIVEGFFPPEIRVVVPIFQGVLDSKGKDTAWEFSVQLSMDVEDGEPSFVLTCPTIEELLHRARLEAVGYLTRLLEPGFMVGLGTLTLMPVPAITS